MKERKEWKGKGWRVGRDVCRPRAQRMREVGEARGGGSGAGVGEREISGSRLTKQVAYLQSKAGDVNFHLLLWGQRWRATTPRSERQTRPALLNQRVYVPRAINTIKYIAVQQRKEGHCRRLYPRTAQLRCAPLVPPGSTDSPSQAQENTGLTIGRASHVACPPLVITGRHRVPVTPICPAP